MEQEINKLIEKFKPLITNIILEDRKYFSFTNIPNWCFFADEDISKVAIFLKKEKLIRRFMFHRENKNKKRTR